MARKAARRSYPGSPSATPAHIHWPSYLLTAVLALAIGAGGTYLALRPRLSAPRISAAALIPPSSPSPPLQLTQGLPPAEAALNRGNWFEDHGNWPAAIAQYTQAIAGGIDNPDIRTDLGVAYFRSGQPQKALTEYITAQKQNPQHENSLYNQGSAYAMLGDAPRALAVWRDYLTRFPQGQHVDEARQMIAGIQAHAR